MNERAREPLAVFQYQSPNDTTFIVAVQQPEEIDGYQLRLSTVVPGSKQIRHDYPVQTYETQAAALAGAEDFIEQLSTRFRDGSLSRDSPSIEATQAAVRDFADHRPFPLFRRLVRILS
ncbi:hypothetical protein IL252_14325 (plasmid) [Halomicrobium sp. IBSBa]|uniref:hypothetical protein n=1 Tax=Halomicrobium sp. IBSBa TaxID=2778916 RepID=UPI001ABEF292|nr:hypothetical protein [Halomicrobium sp. IBSBa]MBO4248994.1 hypothetical protein [Halomicrobium sp. IBSBa]